LAGFLEPPPETLPSGLLTAQVSGEIDPPRGEHKAARPARHAHRTTRAMSAKPANDHTTRQSGSPALPLDRGTTKARLRIFVCNFCATTEVVPWCGQHPDCGHPECTEALARCAAPHRVDDRRFHGQVNVAIIERQLWDRYEEVITEEAS
jgi:hypothetical protein